MSNQDVGNVYYRVIKDVIESSRVDFEDGGVDEAVLDELSKGWQQKLSALNVAHFPWDPKPEPVPAPAPVQQPIQTVPYQPQQDLHTTPSNAQPLKTEPQHMTPQTMMVPQMPVNSGPYIKTEPGLEQMHIPMPATTADMPIKQEGPPAGSTAKERAAFNLQRDFGSSAAASINALQQNYSNQHPGQNMKMPNGGQMQQQRSQQHMQQGQAMQSQQMQSQQMQNQQMQNQQAIAEQGYKQEMARRMHIQSQMARQAAQQPQMPGQNGQVNQARPPNGQSTLQQAQTDGANAYLAMDERGTNSSHVNETDVSGLRHTRITADNELRRHIQERGRMIEGGGLMLPLQRVPRSAEPSKKLNRSAGAAQFDGGNSDDDEKEEMDEDAINSDLDDPDDLFNEEDDDDELSGNTMLCMYDKVARVKNKWKCSMKDGIITVNGRDYVFAKANGEFEW